MIVTKSRSAVCDTVWVFTVYVQVYVVSALIDERVNEEVLTEVV